MRKEKHPPSHSAQVIGVQSLQSDTVSAVRQVNYVEQINISMNYDYGSSLIIPVSRMDRINGLYFLNANPIIIKHGLQSLTQRGKHVAAWRTNVSIVSDLLILIPLSFPLRSL